jgi:hypothetical protein
MELRDVKFKKEYEMMKARICESGGIYDMQVERTSSKNQTDLQM